MDQPAGLANPPLFIPFHRCEAVCPRGWECGNDHQALQDPTGEHLLLWPMDKALPMAENSMILCCSVQGKKRIAQRGGGCSVLGNRIPESRVMEKPSETIESNL